MSKTASLLTLSRTRLGLLLLLSFILLVTVVVARAPASWLSYAVSSQTNVVYLQGVSGTVWRGKAVSGQVNVNGKWLDLGTLDWTLRALPLFTGKLCGTLQTDYPRQSIQGGFCASSGSIEGQGIDISAPLELAKVFAPIFLTGQLTANIQELNLDGQSVQRLAGQITIRDGGYVQGQQYAIGSIAAELSEDGQGGVNGQVFDIQSPLSVDLALNYNPILRPDDLIGVELKGTISESEQLPDQVSEHLQQVMPLLGEQVESGVYKIDFAQ